MKKIITNEHYILNELEKGTYRNQYLMYNRKSTDEPNNQKNSISYQRRENTDYAFKTRLPIAPITIKGFCLEGIISERHSGFKEDDKVLFTKEGYVQYKIERPKFQKLMEYVSKGYIKGVVCLSWDRISRNKGDDTIIRKLMRQGADMLFAYTHYEDTSSGALHMDIDGMFANHRSRVTSEKVKLATKNLREQGICTYRAPIGYLNLGQMNNKPHDPERAPIITDIFKRYAEDKWSISDLTKYAREQGLTSPPMRRRRTEEELLAEEGEVKEIPKISRPITENGIGRILANPFYTGKTLDPDKIYIPSISHEALIDQETFDRVQKILKKKTVSIYYSEKKKHPFRGKIRCGLCRRVYTPYKKKGHLYFSPHCLEGCTNTFKSFNDTFISTELEKIINKLNFSENELAVMEASIQTEIALFHEKRLKELEALNRKKNTTRDSLNYLQANKLSLLQSRVYTPEKLLIEETRLQDNLSNLQQEEVLSDEAMQETMKEVVKVSELLKTLMPYYDFMNLAEKEEMSQILFSELFITKKTLNYKVNSAFKVFEHRLDAMGAQIAWVSEQYKFLSEIKKAVKELEILIGNHSN